MERSKHINPGFASAHPQVVTAPIPLSDLIDFDISRLSEDDLASFAKKCPAVHDYYVNTQRAAQGSAEARERLQKLRPHVQIIANITAYIRGYETGRPPGLLRKYQTDFFHSLLAYAHSPFVEGGLETLVVEAGRLVLPTGSGKTGVFAELIKALTRGDLSQLKSLVLVPWVSLLLQTIGDAEDEEERKGFAKFASEVKATPYYGADKDLSGNAVVMSNAMFLREFEKRPDLLRQFSIFIGDEAHKLGSGKTQSAVDALGHFLLKLGFTATPTASVVQMFPRLVHQMELEEAIEMGILENPRAILLKTNSHLDHIPDLSRRSDYPEELLAQLDQEVRNRFVARVAQSFVARGYAGISPCLPGRQAAHPKRMAELLSSMEVLDASKGQTRPIVARSVSYDMKEADAQRIYRQYERGEVDWIFFIDKIGTGWDSPRAKALVVARPIGSRTVYTQLFGRILRLFGGKEPVVVDILDEALLNSSRRPITALDILEKTDFRQGDRLVPTKPTGEDVTPVDDPDLEGLIEELLAGLSEEERAGLLSADEVRGLKIGGARVSDVDDARLQYLLQSLQHQSQARDAKEITVEAFLDMRASVLAKPESSPIVATTGTHPGIGHEELWSGRSLLAAIHQEPSHSGVVALCDRLDIERILEPAYDNSAALRAWLQPQLTGRDRLLLPQFLAETFPYATAAGSRNISGQEILANFGACAPKLSNLLALAKAIQSDALVFGTPPPFPAKQAFDAGDRGAIRQFIGHSDEELQRCTSADFYGWWLGDESGYRGMTGAQLINTIFQVRHNKERFAELMDWLSIDRSQAGTREFPVKQAYEAGDREALRRYIAKTDDELAACSPTEFYGWEMGAGTAYEGMTGAQLLFRIFGVRHYPELLQTLLRWLGVERGLAGSPNRIDEFFGLVAKDAETYDAFINARATVPDHRPFSGRDVLGQFATERTPQEQFFLQGRRLGMPRRADYTQASQLDIVLRWSGGHLMPAAEASLGLNALFDSKKFARTSFGGGLVSNPVTGADIFKLVPGEQSVNGLGQWLGGDWRLHSPHTQEALDADAREREVRAIVVANRQVKAMSYRAFRDARFQVDDRKLRGSVILEQLHGADSEDSYAALRKDIYDSPQLPIDPRSWMDAFSLLQASGLKAERISARDASVTINGNGRYERRSVRNLVENLVGNASPESWSVFQQVVRGLEEESIALDDDVARAKAAELRGRRS
ncbi:MAG: DEAD/DEAH box helicase [Myxococcaceae bacterium]